MLKNLLEARKKAHVRHLVEEKRKHLLAGIEKLINDERHWQEPTHSYFASRVLSLLNGLKWSKTTWKQSIKKILVKFFLQSISLPTKQQQFRSSKT